MKKIVTAVLVLCTAWTASAQDVTLGALLEEMVSRDNLAKFPELNYDVKQASSYDRRAKVPGGENWFANKDRTQFLRKEVTENGAEWVLFDSDKAGAIVRWWMTFAGNGAGEGILRIYIDGKEKPVIEGTAFDVLSGGLLVGRPLSASVSPITVYKRRGHNLYLPIPYNSCKVTYQDEGIVENEKGEIVDTTNAIYYIINYREYEEGTIVESFNSNSVNKYLKEINEAQTALTNPYANLFRDPPDETRFLQKLDSNDKMQVQLKGEKYIKAFKLNLEAKNLPQALRSTVISLAFDDKETLTIPVGDFFGTGYEINPYETFFTKVFDNGTMASFWPMPFQEEATIEITNYGDQVVAIKDLQLYTDDWSWDDRSMYFGGSWKQFYNKQTGGKEDPEDLNFVTLDGEGVYVGDLVTIYNGANGWWGEGDEKIYIDGEDFPSHFGTGSEDYYGYAWSRSEFFDHPFIAQPDGSGNMVVGTAVNLRFRALDAIPFKKSLDMNMELWHWNVTRVDYAPTTFFYLKPDSRSHVKFDPELAKKEVRFAPKDDGLGDPMMVNNLIQGENMEAIRVDGGIARPRQWPDWEWDEDAQMVWMNPEVNDVMILKFRSSKEIKNVDLELQLTMSGNYGVAALSVNESKEVIFDAYAPEITVGLLEIQEVDINEGSNTVRIQIKENNPKSTGNFFGLDYLKVK